MRSVAKSKACMRILFILMGSSEWNSRQSWTLCAQYAVFTQQILLQYIAKKQDIGTAFLIIENQSSTLWYWKNTYTPLKERHSASISEIDRY